MTNGTPNSPGAPGVADAREPRAPQAPHAQLPDRLQAGALGIEDRTFQNPCVPTTMERFVEALIYTYTPTHVCTHGNTQALVSNDYYPALQRPNCTVVTAGVSEIKPLGWQPSGACAFLRLMD
jgi:hypothetical protein